MKKYCEKCKKPTEFKKERNPFIWLLVVILFPIGLVFLFLPASWRCRECGVYK